MIPLKDTIVSRGVPVVTGLIILINCLVFFLELQFSEDQLQQFVNEYGFIPARLSHDPATWWTLFTCMFLHGGWMHLIGNMWGLFLFGDNVEDRMGSVRYLLFYLLCGIGAGLAHYFTNRLSEIPTVGASGAIAGVFGAYFLLFPTARVITLIPILIFPILVEIPAVIYLGLWFVSQLLYGTATIGAEHVASVAFWAHVGGFIAGMVLMPVFRQRYEA